MIHAVTSAAQGQRDLPALLNGDIPATELLDPGVQPLGTQNFSRPPAAIILGSAYDSGQVSSMQEACKDCSHKVPWLCHGSDPEGGPRISDPGYGETVVKRVKAKLRELRDAGRMNEDGVQFY